MAKKATKTPETPKEPQGLGRPTTYQASYTREAMFLCRLGATDAEMADFFDVTVRTINRWKVTHPEFAEAIRRGKEPADDRVEDSLYHKAVGLEYEKAHPVKLKDVIYDASGKKVAEKERVEVVMVKEVIPADTTAAIFWLKNRRSTEWRDVKQLEHGEPGDFARLSDEELDAEVRAMQKQLSEARRAAKH